MRIYMTKMSLCIYIYLQYIVGPHTIIIKFESETLLYKIFHYFRLACIEAIHIKKHDSSFYTIYIYIFQDIYCIKKKNQWLDSAHVDGYTIYEGMHSLCLIVKKISVEPKTYKNIRKVDII